MGFFSSIGETLGLIPTGGGDAARQAAAGARDFSQQGIETLRQGQAGFQPFLEAGQAQLPGLQAGATPEGFNAAIERLLAGEGTQALIGERERSVQGALGAGGLTRSGAGVQALADVPTDILFQLENLLSGRSSELAGRGQQAAGGIGQLGGGIANIFQQQGQQFASGEITDIQAQAAANKNIVDTAGRIASVLFSDPALKENIEQISKIKDLGLYRWDWIKETAGTIVENYPTIGFMADEVRKLYPQHIGEFGGFMTVDYSALLDELEAA